MTKMNANTNTPMPMTLGKSDWFMPLAGAEGAASGGLRGRIVLGLPVFQVGEREQETVAAADHQRRDAIPLIHDFQVHERRVVLQGLTADTYGFRLALAWMTAVSASIWARC